MLGREPVHKGGVTRFRSMVEVLECPLRCLVGQGRSPQWVHPAREVNEWQRNRRRTLSASVPGKIGGFNGAPQRRSEERKSH